MGWISPTGHYDPSGNWAPTSGSAYDDDLGTYARHNNIPSESWSEFLELTISAIDCNKIRYYGTGLAVITQIDIDVYYNSTWNHIFQGTYTKGSWQEKNLAATYSVTKAKFRLYNSDSENIWVGRFTEFDFFQVITAPTVTTQAASNVQTTTARINGQISDDGGEACQYRFRYKKSGGGYSYTTWTGAKTTGQTFYEDISGLDSGSLYYFNAQAKNSAGESAWGNELEFYTSKVVTASDTGSGTDAFSIKGMTTTDTGTGTDALYKTRTWTEPLELTTAAITAYRVRFWAEKTDDIDEIDLDVYWGGVYNDVYEGSFVGGKWESKTFTQNSITKAKVKFLVDPAYTVKLYDLAFYKVIE